MKNVLEKILEEIEKEQNSYEADHAWNYSKGLEYAKEIIRSHVNDTKDRNIHANDEPYMLFTLSENGVAEEYDNTYDITIHCESEEEQDRVSKILENYHGWIPVEETLPEDGELVKVTVHSSEWIGDFDSNWVPEEDRIYYPEEYHVYDGYLSKNGIWIFYDEEHLEITCEKEFGTDKGRVYDVVTAWMPIELPNPYKGE